MLIDTLTHPRQRGHQLSPPPNLRRGTRAKCKQTLVAQLKVRYIRRHLIWTLNVTILVNTESFTSGPTRTITLDSFTVLAMQGGKSCSSTIQMHTDEHVHTQTGMMQTQKMHRFICDNIARLSSSLSLSLCRRIFVPVKVGSHHNPKQNSKLLLPTVSNRPEIKIAPTM